MISSLQYIFGDISLLEKVLFVVSFVGIVVVSMLFIGEYIKDIYYFFSDRKKK